MAAPRKTRAKAAAKQPPATVDNPPSVAPADTGDIELEVSTRLERRIRAGIVVTKEPRTVRVSKAVATALESDPHISVTTK